MSVSQLGVSHPYRWRVEERRQMDDGEWAWMTVFSTSVEEHGRADFAFRAAAGKPVRLLRQGTPVEPPWEVVEVDHGLEVKP